MPFTTFKLSAKIEHAIVKNGYTQPTAIQEQVIPLVMSQKDIIAKAQTGSGKTAAFVLPILNGWLEKNAQSQTKKRKISTLVLTPTRDLAIQVANSFETFSAFFDRKPIVVTVIGGESIGDQLLQIQKECDIVVATTGRLLDILNKKQMNLSFLDFFVLDEADKMLDLGFMQEMDLVLENLPQKRQNLLFSATYPPKMVEIASLITQNPVEVFIEAKENRVQNIEQRAILVNTEKRSALLRHLLKTNQWEQTLVFMSTKKACDNIAHKFFKYGLEAESFHGDLVQDERNGTLEDFKAKKIRILFATDIAARGLHIDDIACVINYDLPRSTNDYVHRIGRTGRAGKTGTAISFITQDNHEHFTLIEKRCELSVSKEQVEGFEFVGEMTSSQKGKEPIKGKRKSKKDKLREKAAKKDTTS